MPLRMDRCSNLTCPPFVVDDDFSFSSSPLSTSVPDCLLQQRLANRLERSPTSILNCQCGALQGTLPRAVMVSGSCIETVQRRESGSTGGGVARVRPSLPRVRNVFASPGLSDQHRG